MALTDLLNQAVDLSVEELRVDRCEIWMCHHDDTELELRAGSGWPDGSGGTRIPLAPANQPGYTVLRGQGAVVVEDFRREGRFQPVEPPDPDLLPGTTSVQSAISVRIPGDEGAFGAFVVSSKSLRRFELSDISLIESLAQLLGAAIERVRVNDSLTEAEHRVRTLIERLPSITYRAGLGQGGEWTFISPQVEEILGYTVEEWIADSDFWENHIHPDDVERVLAEEASCAAENRPLDVEYRMQTSEGRMIWVRDRASLGELNEHGVMIVEGLITDVSEQKAAEERLRYLADHDELTGLLNRRGFDAAADLAINGGGLPGGRGAMVIVDLDHLKRVNDSLGRATGDRVIAEIAQLLEAELGTGYVFGRIDSDEFGLLIPGRRRGPGARARRLPALRHPLPRGRRDAHGERRHRPRRERDGRQLRRPPHRRGHRRPSGQAGRPRPQRRLHRRGPQQARMGRPRPQGDRRAAARPLLTADRRHGDRRPGRRGAARPHDRPRRPAGRSPPASSSPPRRSSA